MRRELGWNFPFAIWLGKRSIRSISGRISLGSRFVEISCIKLWFAREQMGDLVRSTPELGDLCGEEDANPGDRRELAGPGKGRFERPTGEEGASYSGRIQGAMIKPCPVK
jgi:hypothetical protein